MFLQEQAGIVAPLAQPFAAKRNPSAGFFQDPLIDAKVDQIALAGNAFTIEDVEFGFAEWRGNLVLHDFGARTRTDDAIAFLDGLNAPNIEANRGIKLQCA